MALRGAPQKDNSVNRNPKVHDYLEFENVPFMGERPDLPATRTVAWISKDDGPQSENVPLCRLTLDWWESLSSLPHCSAWSAADWSFAIASALIADAVFSGDMTRAAELRQRETQMWATADARRSNRVRYIEPKKPSVSDATVTDIDDYRDL